MTLKIKKGLIWAFLIVFFAVFACWGIVAFANGNGQSVFAVDYTVGENFIVPEKDISYGGKTARATATVVFPSGVAYSAQRITLTEAGRYSVVYRAEIDSKIVKETEYIYAYDSLYSFSGEKSSAYYGLDVSQYQTGKTALNVSLASGEKLTFNKIIDLKEAGTGFVEFYFTPKTRGTPEAQGVFFTLTDVYDPDNVVKFQFKNVAYLGSDYVYRAAYVTAGFGNELPRAWTYDSGDKVWRLRINDKFGTGTDLTMYGWAEDYGGTAIRDTFCRFSLDLNTKKAYLSDSFKNNAEIIDFDEPAFFDTLWGGFTTGEVILAVEGYDYTGQTLNINFTDVAGYDFDDVSVVKDTEAPEINVFTEDYDENDLPIAYKGESYPVFDAYAFDKGSGDTEVSVRAFYGYDSDTEIELNVNDGRVATDRVGKYKLVYTATDAFGNKAEKTLYFYAIENPRDLEVSLTGAYDTAVKVGKAAKLAGYTATGGSGSLSTSVRADADCRIDLDEYTIVPLETGEITISWVVEDVTGYSESAEYVLTVSDNEDPVILDLKPVPDYIFGGLKIKFPEMAAHDFNADADVSTSVYVDGVMCENNIYTPENRGTTEIAEPYTVNLQYKADGKVVFEKTLTVLDVLVTSGPTKQFRVEGYWVKDGFTSLASESGVRFTAAAGADTATAKFAKPVIYDSFSIGTTMFNADFDEYSFRLTDYDNPKNKITIGFIKEDGKTILTVDGENTGYVLSKGGFYSDETFNVSIVNGVIQDGGSLNYYIGAFSAEKVMIEVAASGIHSGASFTVTQICDTSLTSRTTRDQIEPIVITKGEYSLFAEIGEELAIHPVIAEDLLDTFVDAKVSVIMTTATGETKTLLSDANAFAENFVKVKDYGAITVRYSVKDGNGNERKPSYTISVVKLSDPVITFNGKVNKAVKLGATLKFDQATAKDGFGKDLQVKYFVVKPSLMPVLLGADRTFTPTWAGTYIFRIYAADDYGNVGVRDYSFKVVK
ncbi:MAG: hypothetical protein IJU83_03520 [Clostridia bacterium]|nr:hypothetical protein [Clostridia bacterium]